MIYNAKTPHVVLLAAAVLSNANIIGLSGLQQCER